MSREIVCKYDYAWIELLFDRDHTSSLSSKALLSSSEVDWFLFKCPLGGVGLGAALTLPRPGGEASCRGPWNVKILNYKYCIGFNELDCFNLKR